MCEECGCGIPENVKKEAHTHKEEFNVYRSLLEENEKQADGNREHLFEHKCFAVNLMGSPGAGKTALLEAIVKKIGGKYKIAAVEGDLATERDAERLRKLGIEAVQIMTGSTCHLDAKSLHNVLHDLKLSGLDLLFIENVGNLVCPAFYDLGCHLNGVLLSVTEGADKVAKYPVIFRKSQFFAVTKTDLLPYVDFAIEQPKKEAKMLKGDIRFFNFSSKSGEGIDDFINYILREREIVFS
jgi:hydrogenase nickel incorporation protein HypB